MKKRQENSLYKELKKTFGKRCSDLRCDDEKEIQENGKTTYINTSMQKLADKFSSIIKASYDKSKISRIEKGTAEITILDLFLYSEYYKVSYNFLLGQSRNKKDKYFSAFEKYGLSDQTLDILSNIVKNKGNKEIKALNAIFASGLAQPFLEYLYDFFYNDYEKRLPQNYKVTGGEIIKVELRAKAGKLDLGEDYVPLEKMNIINRQIVYDKLNEIKQALQDK